MRTNPQSNPNGSARATVEPVKFKIPRRNGVISTSASTSRPGGSSGRAPGRTRAMVRATTRSRLPGQNERTACASACFNASHSAKLGRGSARSSSSERSRSILSVRFFTTTRQ